MRYVAKSSNDHQPSSLQRSQQLAELTQINIHDLLGGLGLDRIQRGRRFFEVLCHLPARRFAAQVAAYDDLVGTDGLQAGGRWALQKFAPRWKIDNQEHVPVTGPTLIVANHPGLCDTVALFTAIARPDLRIVAADRQFLRALPHTSRHLLVVDETSASRLTAIRAVARHLRQGGAVLTFPSGQIDPDPAVLPGAIEALEQWSLSIELFVRLAGNVTIVPAIVSGVLSSAALRHPLTYLRRRPKDRQWLAALLQIQFRSLQSETVQVMFGQPLHIRSEAEQQMVFVSEAVKAEARRLLEQIQRKGN